MTRYLNEMENEGMVVFGRPIRAQFESAAAIEAAADEVERLSARFGVSMSFIYCGTTINWPDEFEYTPCVIGHVSFVGYGDDYDDEPTPIPASAFEPTEIPDGFWEALREYGLELERDADELYLAVGGWTWASIQDAGGANVAMVSAEDYGYTRIGDKAVIKNGENLTMRVSYC